MEKKINTFTADLWNIIAPAIEKGISGSTIADALQMLGIDRMNALALVTAVGAWMNYEAHPELTPEQAFKMYAGI